MVLGLAAACVPILPTGDYRADDYARLRARLVGLAFLSIPAVVVVRAVLRGRRMYENDAKANRTAQGLCVRCGYSLRGNVSGVCPECGKPAERATAQPQKRRDDLRGPTPFRFRITRAEALGPGDHFARRILLEGAELEGEIRPGDGIIIPVKVGDGYRGTVLDVERYNQVLATLSDDADPAPFYITAWPRDMDPDNIRHDIATGQLPG